MRILLAFAQHKNLRLVITTTFTTQSVARPHGVHAKRTLALKENTHNLIVILEIHALQQPSPY